MCTHRCRGGLCVGLDESEFVLKKVLELLFVLHEVRSEMRN
jgi:hypothetical protein